MSDKPRIIFTRYPAFRLLCGVALGIFFYHTASWNETGFILMFSSLGILACTVYYSRNYHTSFWIAAFALGLWTGNAAQQFRTPSLDIRDIPSVFHGEVVSLLRSDSLSIRCLVSGTLDAQPLPAIRPCRVILTVPLPTEREGFLRAGASIYAVGMIRTPARPTLPMEFDERQYCMAQDVQFLMTARPSQVALLEKAHGLPAVISRCTQAIEERIRLLYSDETAAIVTALLLGNQSKISPETRARFSLSGTAHILSVSGSHVGIIAALVMVILGFVRHRWLKFFIFTVAVSTFILLSGMQPSALRAGLMAVLGMLGYTWQRRIYALNIVSLSVVILLLSQPTLIYSAGFQMSVVSVAGISIFYAPFRTFLLSLLPFQSSSIEFIASSLALTFAASVSVSPLVAYYFSTFSVVSPLANLFVVPLMSLGMVFGMLSIVVVPINVGIATTYSAATAWCIRMADAVNRWSVELPASYVHAPELAFMLSILVSSALLLVLMSQSRRQAAFRVIMSSISIFFIVRIADVQPSVSRLIPRTNVAVSAIPLQKDSTLILITDRKPHLYPSIDRALVEFIATLPDSAIVGIRGNVSEWTAVQAHELRPSVKFFILSEVIGT
jgi:ComEC/Rec2-related protein